MTSNYSTIEEEAEEIEYENETSHSIYLGFLRRYITLTNYYMRKHVLVHLYALTFSIMVAYFGLRS